MKKKLLGLISVVAMAAILSVPVNEQPVEVAKHTIHPSSISFTYYM